MNKAVAPTGPLAGLRILDLSRILAGPTLSQFLGDLGADILKIERPGAGDDTRKWGPPDIASRDPDAPGWSSYFLCANRNKRSVAIDISQGEGQALVRELAFEADIVLENFKAGSLKKYGLSYDDLSDDHPRLIYCSITGFGQTGPLSHRPGYDAMIQAMGGIMSLTGEPDGEPMKVGVGVSDIVCGMVAGMSILAALHHRDKTGEGQYIDVALLDTQLSWLVNEGQNYLVSGKVPKRRGTAHPNIVPYQVFPSSDGHFMLAVGNDRQFGSFCDVAGAGELARDDRFASNSARVRNRDELVPLLRVLTARHPTSFWIDELDRVSVPCGVINNVEQVFAEPQIIARNMRITLENPRVEGGQVDFIANPVKLSRTPVNYRHFPPEIGEHTDEVLREVLGLDDGQLEALKSKGVISDANIKQVEKES